LNLIRGHNHERFNISTYTRNRPLGRGGIAGTAPVLSAGLPVGSGYYRKSALESMGTAKSRHLLSCEFFASIQPPSKPFCRPSKLKNVFSDPAAGQGADL